MRPDPAVPTPPAGKLHPTKITRHPDGRVTIRGTDGATVFEAVALSGELTVTEGDPGLTGRERTEARRDGRLTTRPMTPAEVRAWAIGKLAAVGDSAASEPEDAAVDFVVDPADPPEPPNAPVVSAIPADVRAAMKETRRG